MDDQVETTDGRAGNLAYTPGRLMKGEREDAVTSSVRKWVVVGLTAGLLGDAAFFVASVLGQVAGPSLVGFIVGAAFGPLITLGFIGLFFFIGHHSRSMSLIVATLFGVIAGTIVNLMIVVQHALALGFDTSQKSVLGDAWDAVWMVQLGLDVSWDIYFSMAMILFGVAMWRHPRLGPIFGAITVVIGAGLLILNVATFPEPPASSGLIDLGPVAGVWFAVLSLRALKSLNWIEETPGMQPLESGAPELVK